MESVEPSFDQDADGAHSPSKRKLVDETESSDIGDTSLPLKKLRCSISDGYDLVGNNTHTETTSKDGGDEAETESLDDVKKQGEDSVPVTKVVNVSGDAHIDLAGEGSEAPQKQQQPLPDPLGYTQAEEFTSEIYKIQIHNMPKFGFNQLKKRLISLGLKPHKVKSPNQKVTYVCFRNDADRKEAIHKLHGHVWKGKTLDAKEAAPIADPFLKKRQEYKECASGPSDGKKEIPEKQPMSQEEALERLRGHVMPLCNVEYTKQLEMKTDKIKEVLVKISKHPFVKDQYRKTDGWKFGDMACPLLPIIPSPLTSDYRNKNEFTVGYGLDGKTIKVGFRYGMYKDGTTAVGEPDNLGNVMPAALPVVQSFQKFVTESKWPPYLQQTGAGHWHTLTVRTFHSGDVMAMVDFDPRRLDKTQIEEAKMSLKEFYTNGDGKEITITSFYFRLVGKESKSLDKSQKLGQLFGETHIHESLLGLKFRISPEAFFQVNTLAAERLYSLVGEWSEVTDATTVLDICCGTGTIGLSMAKRAKDMIGIEMCQPAVEDAIVNADLNGITNATFHCAKVEDVIGRIMSSLGLINTSFSLSPPSSPSSSPSSTDSQSDVVAIVDPPRAGLHKNVIKTLRRCKEIQRLIYVSCNPESGTENFVDLIRPATGKHKGQPFTLVKAIPVDLFPGTKHCELVLLFNHGSTKS